MKKKLILFTILFVVIYGTKAQKNDAFNVYLGYFNKTNLPIDTRIYMKFKRDDSKIIPDNLALNFLYKNDTNKQHYYLQLISDITQKITFSGYVKYSVWAAEHYYLNNYVFITYERSRQDEGEQYYLTSFTNEGLLCDSLLVLSSNDEGEWVDWICSKIYQNQIFVFHYSRDIKIKNTKITVNTYQIDEKTGAFSLKNQEIFNSKYTIDDFNGKNEKCISEDPFYRY